MKIKITILMLLISCYDYGQGIIPITETSLQLTYDETKEVYYSFEEGDQILFNLNMVQGRHMREIEIVELPANTVFSTFKANEIIGKKIKVRRRGVYKFRFYNSSLTNRTCRYTIHRIPANESTRSFNTNWEWAIQRDTTYTSYQQDSLVGHETIKYQETKRELKKLEKQEILVFDKWQKVNSLARGNDSRNFVKVDLPKGIMGNLREEKIIGWAYWVGVGQASKNALEKNKKSLANLTKTVASNYISPLGALALGELTNLIIPNTGEDVEYYFMTDYDNVLLFKACKSFYFFDTGKGRAAYGISDNIREKSFYIGLLNNNSLIPIEVNVKVIAIKEIKTFENVTYNREKENPQYLTLNKTQMHIEETKIRVPVEH
ncbi:hypothetical protein [Spongiimicrobium salis]|uniref:hypothetical protein n=1 Tax=Spongiimicrobium salis TaxID=1667022 RepID=UPI00374D35A0